jgi:hypothetical protein
LLKILRGAKSMFVQLRSVVLSPPGRHASDAKKRDAPGEGASRTREIVIA